MGQTFSTTFRRALSCPIAPEAKRDQSFERSTWPLRLLALRPGVG